jgi:gas vesicle protein
MPLVTSGPIVQENDATRLSTRPPLEESAAFSPIANNPMPLSAEQEAALQSNDSAFGQLWAETKVHEGIEEVQDKADELQEKAEDVKEDVKDAAQDAKENAKETAHDLKSTLQDTADSAMAKMQEAGHVALEKGKELAAVVQDKVNGAGDVAREKGKEFAEKMHDAGDAALEKGKELVGAMQEKAGEAKALGQEKAVEAQHKLEEWKDVAFEKGSEVKDQAASALAPVQHAASSVAVHAKDVALAMAHVVTDVVHNVQEKLHFTKAHDATDARYPSYTEFQDSGDRVLHAAPVLHADELPATL